MVKKARKLITDETDFGAFHPSRDELMRKLM